MALKAVLTKAEFETLSDPIREYYVADGENFVLDAEIDLHPKVMGLKSAFEKVKKDKKDGDAEFRRLREQIGDMDPEKAREALKRVQEMADKHLLDEGKVDELIKARTDSLIKAHATEKTAFETKLTESEKARGALETEVTSLILDGTLRDESIKAGVKKEHIDDVLYRMKDRGIDGIKWRLGEGRTVVAMQGDEMKYGKDVQPMSPGEGLEMLKKAVPGFFEPSSGGGASNRGQTDAHGRYRDYRIGCAGPSEVALRISRRRKSGTAVTDYSVAAVSRRRYRPHASQGACCTRV